MEKLLNDLWKAELRLARLEFLKANMYYYAWDDDRTGFKRTMMHFGIETRIIEARQAVVEAGKRFDVLAKMGVC